jgi:hypothetical protein
MTVEPAPDTPAIPDLKPAAEVEESRAVRALRALRWLSRFRQWFGSVWAGVARAANEQLESSLTGRQPPPEDPALRPEHYAAILDFPEQPDRPQLSRFERVSAEEAISIERVARFVSAAVVRTYTDMRKSDVAVKATRAQHAKHHGCVQATFIVHENLAPEHAIGVFRPGARYPAVIRFSNSKGTRESDKSADGRGMAIKLRNVPGRNILAGQIPQAGLAEQDFLISGHPVFFCRDAADYTVFMAMLDRPRTTRGENLRFFVEFAKFFLTRPPRVGLAFARTALRKVTSPLESDYHSMTPYLLGPDKVVRYVATPLSRRRRRKRRSDLGDNYLHDALAEALDPGSHPEGAVVTFDFAVQIKHDPKPVDVEDACLRWRGRRDVKVSLARIEIPMQIFDMSNQDCTCQDLSFNPWNCLPEHQPLGSLNRMRLAVYTASARARHRLNGV